MLTTRLSKGTGHNLYGEAAWPNDILYIFPVVILGVISTFIGIAITEPLKIREQAQAFNTPLVILPEWYFYPVFNLLRTLPDKLIGMLSLLVLVLMHTIKGLRLRFI